MTLENVREASKPDGPFAKLLCVDRLNVLDKFAVGQMDHDAEVWPRTQRHWPAFAFCRRATMNAVWRKAPNSERTNPCG